MGAITHEILRVIGLSERPAFQGLYHSVDYLSRTVPQSMMDTKNTHKQYTRRIPLTRDETAEICRCIREDEIFCSWDVKQFFGRLAIAWRYSHNQMTDEIQPFILKDINPVTESIGLRIPSPTPDLDGIRLLFERTPNSKKKGLVQTVSDSGDWIEQRREVTRDETFFPLCNTLDSITKHRLSAKKGLLEKIQVIFSKV